MENKSKQIKQVEDEYYSEKLAIGTAVRTSDLMKKVVRLMIIEP
jgi:hypothetical protein